MKLSNDLLRQLALGIGVSAALTSCSMFEKEQLTTSECDEDCTKEQCEGDCHKAATPDYDYCPACGMG